MLTISGSAHVGIYGTHLVPAAIAPHVQKNGYILNATPFQDVGNGRHILIGMPASMKP